MYWVICSIALITIILSRHAPNQRHLPALLFRRGAVPNLHVGLQRRMQHVSDADAGRLHRFLLHGDILHSIPWTFEPILVMILSYYYEVWVMMIMKKLQDILGFIAFKLLRLKTFYSRFLVLLDVCWNQRFNRYWDEISKLWINMSSCKD